MKCQIDGCERPGSGRGLCKICYQRQLRRGRLHRYPPIRTGRSQGEEILRAALGHKGKECLIWPLGLNEGYGALNAPGLPRRAHRAMCLLAHGPAPEADMDAAHNCGRRACYNPNHLRWATRQSNLADMDTHGTRLVGEACPWAKISREQARAIFLDPRPSPETARDYDCSPRHVRDIRARKKWKEATADLR